MKYKILYGDCLDVMLKFKFKVDMIFSDNPYGETKHSEDIIIDCEKLWIQYKRIIKEEGVIALNSSFKFGIKLINSCKIPFRYDWVWNKKLVTGHLNSNKMPMRKHEFLLIFYKKLPVFNPQFTQGNPLHSKGKNYKNKEIINNNYGKFYHTDDKRKGSILKYPTSIIEIQKPHPSVAKHRTEKPIELVEYFIKTYTNEGMTVLDNCAGSGNVGKVCKKLNRNFVLIEKNKEKYFNLKKIFKEKNGI